MIHKNPCGRTAGTDIQDIKRTLEKLEYVLKLRTQRLCSYEDILTNLLGPNGISLLNPGSRRGMIIKGQREHTTMQMQCKILRRNVFILRERRVLLLEALESLIEGEKPIQEELLATDEQSDDDPSEHAA